MVSTIGTVQCAIWRISYPWLVQSLSQEARPYLSQWFPLNDFNVFLPCVNGFGWGLSREETVKNHPVPVVGVHVHVKRRVGSTLKRYNNLFCTMKSSTKSSEHKTSNKSTLVATGHPYDHEKLCSYLIPIQVETIHRFQGSFGHSDWTGRYFTGSVVCSRASERNLVFYFWVNFWMFS